MTFDPVALAGLSESSLFAVLVVFARLGTALMLFPGLGENFVPARSRLIIAFGLSMILAGSLANRLPPQPDQVTALAAILARESVIGLFIGVMLRTLVDSIDVAGSVIALQTGLSNATVLNPTQGMSNLAPSALLSMAGLVLIFITGLDHLMIRALVATYDFLPADQTPLLLGDFANAFGQLVARSFAAGVSFAAPFIVIGILFNVALGIMQRLMPMIPLFLLALPGQIAAGLILFAVILIVVFTAWLKYIDQGVGTLLTGSTLFT